MAIDKIGNINKIIVTDKPQALKSKAKSQGLGSDSVSISKEALRAQELATAQKHIKSTSEVRQEKVKEIKAKMNNGNYDNIDNEILDRVAEKIAQAFIR